MWLNNHLVLESRALVFISLLAWEIPQPPRKYIRLPTRFAGLVDNPKIEPQQEF